MRVAGWWHSLDTYLLLSLPLPSGGVALIRNERARVHAGWQQPRGGPRTVRHDAEGVIKPSATLGADASRAANAGRITLGLRPKRSRTQCSNRFAVRVSGN